MNVIFGTTIEDSYSTTFEMPLETHMANIDINPS